MLFRSERAVAEAGNSWLAPLPAVSPVSLTVICGTTVRLSLVIAFVVLGRIARQWSREQLAELRAMSGEGLEAALAAACAAS